MIETFYQSAKYYTKRYNTYESSQLSSIDKSERKRIALINEAVEACEAVIRKLGNTVDKFSGLGRSFRYDINGLNRITNMLQNVDETDKFIDSLSLFMPTQADIDSILGGMEKG